ncbi:aromatic acid exporter family protein [Gorillibacterium massiliense]|uniref:aromatic acid exporter family protein n=1 Tax=Gorillibacterium massiliense TaxID=1280390 RepID=UPI0009DFF4B9|nr:aromatic acid exporter family protein [Gorillibacterium massiliense]
MTFGARIIKTGLAVTLALYASSLFGMSSPVIAAVAAVFAMQPSIYRSWHYLLEQIQTNALGAVLAMLALYLFENDPIAVGIVCIVVIIICLKLNLEETLAVTLVTVIAIMEAPGAHEANLQTWDFALNRFLLSCIGIACAVAVNVAVMPPRPRERFKEQVIHVFNRLSLLLRMLISDEMKDHVFREEKKKLRDELKSLASKFELFEEEQKKMKRSKYSRSRELVVNKQLVATLVKGAAILDAAEEHYFKTDRPESTDHRFDQHLEQLIRYHEVVLLNYQHKVKPESVEEMSIHEENDIFMEHYVHLSRENEAGGTRLVVVAAAVYEYGYQVGRLDKLVQLHDRPEEGKEERAGEQGEPEEPDFDKAEKRRGKHKKTDRE